MLDDGANEVVVVVVVDAPYSSWHSLARPRRRNTMRDTADDARLLVVAITTVGTGGVVDADMTAPDLGAMRWQAARRRMDTIDDDGSMLLWMSGDRGLVFGPQTVSNWDMGAIDVVVAGGDDITLSLSTFGVVSCQVSPRVHRTK